MSLVDMKTLPNRLVDYVLVVSSLEAPKHSGGVLCPKMLRRYPEEDIRGSPLPPDVVFFCQPDGCYACEMTREEMLEQQKIFLFCLTEKDSNIKRYGTCLNFFRPCRDDNRPTSTQTIPEEAEEEGEDGTGRRGEERSSTKATADSPNSTRKSADDSEPVYRRGVLTSVCLLSHHGFFSSFKEILMTFRDIVENLQMDGETAIDMENGWRRLINPSLAATDPCASAIQTWVNGLLAAPTPQPGKTCVELELAIMPTLTLAYPDASRFPLIDFPLHLPVDLLGPSMLIEVLTIVILEQKIVFQSRDYNLLSMCVMAIVSLLFPLEYLFPIIPLLPTSLPNAETLLLAPSPYIIGVPASFFHPDRGVFLPEDVYHVDLDCGHIDRPANQPDLPEPPEKILRILTTRLERCLEVVHTVPFPNSPSSSSKGDTPVDASTPRASVSEKPRTQSGRKLSPSVVEGNAHPLADIDMGPWPLSASKRTSLLAGVPLPPQTPQQTPNSSSASLAKTPSSAAGDKSASLTAGEDEIDGSLAADIVAVDVHIRVAFVRFLLCDDMLANYRRFLRTVRLHSRPVVMLQKNGFLTSIQSGASPFLKSLANTQALETFGEFELNPTTTAHWRIQQDLTNAVYIGDKHKWFKDKLAVVQYSLCEGCEALSMAMLQEKSMVLDSDSDDYDSSDSYASSSSSSMILITDPELVGDTGPQAIRILRRPYDEAHVAEPVPPPWEAQDNSDRRKPAAKERETRPPAKDSARIIQQPVLPSVDFARAKPNAKIIPDRSEIVDSGSAKAVDFSPARDSLTADISAVTVHVDVDVVGSPNLLLDEEEASSRPLSQIGQHPEQGDKSSSEPDANVPSQPAPSADVASAQNEEIRAKADSQDTTTTGGSELKTVSSSSTLTVEAAEETDADSTDFYAPPLTRGEAHQPDALDRSDGQPVHQAKAEKGIQDFELLNTPADCPKPAHPSIISTLAEEFENVSDAAMAFVGTVGEETRSMLTVADGLSRKAVASHTQSVTRVKQIRMVNHHSRKRNRPAASQGSSSDSSPVTSKRLHPSEFFDNLRRSSLHKQLARRESNLNRRPSPHRSRSLSFSRPVDYKTGRVSSPVKGDSNAASSAYDKAVFGTRLGHGDLAQEQQVFDMEFRWMKSQRKYFASSTSDEDHIFNPFPIFRRNLSDRLKGLPPSKRLNNFTLEQPSIETINTSENQRFVYEITTGVLDGKGVPWLKQRRLEKLLMTECMRHAVLNTICETTGVSAAADGVPDIWLYKPVYSGVLSLLRFVLGGIEKSVAAGGQETISSSYHFLEVCYSHFSGRYIRADKVQLTDGTPVSGRKTSSSPDSVTSQDDSLVTGKFSPASEDDSTLSQTSSLNQSAKKRAISLPPQALPLDQRSDRGVIGISGRTSLGSTPDRPVGEKQVSTKDGMIRRADPHPNIIHPATKAEESRNAGKAGRGATDSPSPSENSAMSLDKESPKKTFAASLGDECLDRRYLYEEFLGKNRSALWDNMDFWETFFGDIVAQERQAMGLNDNPVQLIERFRRLSSVDRVCLEHEEDLALTGLLVNMAAFMVAMGVSHTQITSKIRRLVGRAHIGLQFSQHVYDILKVLEPAKGNAFELWPLRSRQIHRQTFMVHQGESMSGDMCIIEVSDLAIVLNDFTGEVRQRWFYEDIVRVNYHPSSCVLCMWVREEDGVLPYNFWCVKKGRLLYDAVENYINGSSAPAIFGSSITGQFPVRDADTGDAAVLTLAVDGVSCRFSQGRSQLSFDLSNIDNCAADGDLFLLSIADEQHELKTYRFESLQVAQIVQTIMNIFSVVAALAKKDGATSSASAAAAVAAAASDEFKRVRQSRTCAAEVALLDSDILLPSKRLTGGDRSKSYYTDEGGSEEESGEEIV